MNITELITSLTELKEEHGDQPCYLEYDGSIIHLDSVSFGHFKAERDVYTDEPKDSVYTGVLFSEYE